MTPFYGKNTVSYVIAFVLAIGRVSLARENEAGGSWGQEVHIVHVTSFCFWL